MAATAASGRQLHPQFWNTLKSDTISGSTSNTTYTCDAANRLTASNGTGAYTYSNDADGNVLGGGGRTNTWDSQNRLVSCSDAGTASTYAYGADGLRHSETVTPSGSSAVTTNNVYDGSMLVQEQRSNATYATYLNGPRGPECRVDETQPTAESGYKGTQLIQRGPTKWYIFDGLGSVVGEIDPNGNLTSTATYDVYGAKRAGGTGTATSRQGFVGSLGHIADTETGLVYMRARYYDPLGGRFISEDPARSGKNWFQYCSASPTNLVDSTGLDDLGEELTSEADGEILDESGDDADYQELAAQSFKKSKLFNSKGLVNFIASKFGVTEEEASAIIHELKADNQLKGADDIRICDDGTLYTTNQVELGNISAFLPSPSSDLEDTATEDWYLENQ